MKFSLFLLVWAILLACTNGQSAQKPEVIVNVSSAIDGEKLFKVNCSQCHRPAEDFAAPALAGSKKRWPNKKLLYEFVRNSQDVIARNKYAAALFEKWNKGYMQPFTHLSDKEIEAILKYCDSRAK